MIIFSVQLILRVRWFKEFLGLAIDQKSENQLYPLTSYYVWPKTEAWEQLKLELDSRPWLSKKDKIQVLNITTETINYWKKNRELESREDFFPNPSNINFIDIQN